MKTFVQFISETLKIGDFDHTKIYYKNPNSRGSLSKQGAPGYARVVRGNEVDLETYNTMKREHLQKYSEDPQQAFHMLHKTLRDQGYTHVTRRNGGTYVFDDSDHQNASREMKHQLHADQQKRYDKYQQHLDRQRRNHQQK